jgi:hypothetical protein
MLEYVYTDQFNKLDYSNPLFINTADIFNINFILFCLLKLMSAITSIHRFIIAIFVSTVKAAVSSPYSHIKRYTSEAGSMECE